MLKTGAVSSSPIVSVTSSEMVSPAPLVATQRYKYFAFVVDAVNVNVSVVTPTQDAPSARFFHDFPVFTCHCRLSAPSVTTVNVTVSPSATIAFCG